MLSLQSLKKHKMIKKSPTISPRKEKPVNMDEQTFIVEDELSVF